MYVRLATAVTLTLVVSANISMPQSRMGQGGWLVSQPEAIFKSVFDGSTRRPAYPAVAVGASGHVYVAAWAYDRDQSSWDLFVRIREPDSGSWSSPVNVSREHRGGTGLSFPRMVMTREDYLVVGYPNPGASIAWSTDHGQTFQGPVDVSQGIPGTQMDFDVDIWGTVHVLWRGQDAGGEWDMYYSYAPGSVSGRFPGIDQGRFVPMINITDDDDLQRQPSLSAGGLGTSYAAFDTDLGPGMNHAELITISNGVPIDRYRFDEDDRIPQVAVSGTGNGIVALSTQDGPTSPVKPIMMPIIGSNVIDAVRDIPFKSDHGGPPSNSRATQVLNDGTVGLAFSVCSIVDRELCRDVFIELTISRNWGATFAPSIQLLPFEDELGDLYYISTYLALDSSGVMHVVATADAEFFSTLSHSIVYFSAKYN